MREKVNFKCIGDNLENIPEDIIQKTGLTFPKAHTKGEYMSILSKALKVHRRDDFCRLPFCNTVEAEAFGGYIKLGDEKTGPRVEKYLFNSIDELENIKEIDLNNGRIKEVLDAIEKLARQGENVILNVEGPFTIISSLIDSTIFYKAIRKNREVIDKFIGVIEDSIIKYAKEGVKRGAKIISYGDPVGTLDLVGPKVFKEVSAKASIRILKTLENEIDNALIHVCGKASCGIYNIELSDEEKISYDENSTYGQGLISVLKKRPDIKIVGHACIKRTPLHLKDNSVYKIILH